MPAIPAGDPVWGWTEAWGWPGMTGGPFGEDERLPSSIMAAPIDDAATPFRGRSSKWYLRAFTSQARWIDPAPARLRPRCETENR